MGLVTFKTGSMLMPGYSLTHIWAMHTFDKVLFIIKTFV